MTPSGTEIETGTPVRSPAPRGELARTAARTQPGHLPKPPFERLLRATARPGTVLSRRGPAVPRHGPSLALLRVDDPWNGAERRSDDPLRRFSRELDALCTQAVDSAEIAAGLESAGWTDGRVRAEHGLPDVFTLADQLFRITSRRPQRWVGEATNPWRERPWWHLARGLIFAVPGLIYLTVIPSLTTTRAVTTLSVALVLGWATGQAVSYLGSYLTGMQRNDAALAWLRAGVLAGGLLAAGVLAGALAVGVGVRVGAVAAGQVLYMVSASALLARGEESVVALVLCPGLVCGLGLLSGSRTAQSAALTGSAASVLASWLAAGWLTRGAPMRRLRRELAAEDIVAALWEGGYGVAAGVLVATLVGLAPDSPVGQFALAPLIWSMGVAEWQLVGFRRRGFDLLATSTSMAAFARGVRGLVLRCVVTFSVPLTLLSGAVLLAAGYLSVSRWAPVLCLVLAGWLLGLAFLAALLSSSLGGVRWAVSALATASGCAAIGMCLPVGDARVDLAPLAAVALTLVGAVRTARDPTRHI
jgi:hypothetical protein